MYLLNQFARRKGSKDKRKRKSIINASKNKRNLGAKTVTYNGVKYKLSASKPSTVKNKKRYRLVTNTSTGKTKKVNYGHSSYGNYGNGKGNHKSLKRKANYLSRSAGIRDSKGVATKDNPMSSNYMSRNDLWSSSNKLSDM